MAWINIVAGVVLLLFGRRLFWLFVAGVGFVVGAKVATELLNPNQPEWLILAIALGAGFLGAMFCVFMQKLVLRIAGFLAGGYILYTLAIEYSYDRYAWAGFLVGGIIGALLVITLLNFALMVLSSFLGATVITQNLPLEKTFSDVVLVALAIFGMIVQAGQSRRKAPAQERGESK